MTADEVFQLADRMARQSACANRNSTTKTRKPQNGGSLTSTEELAELLRACPPDRLPATPEFATAPDPPPNDTSSFNLPLSSLQGTPAAKSWDDAWLDVVNAAETRIGRRICGARTMDGTPCELGSNHPSGRCRFHGGFDLTGAAPGNRNAYIHGLYSRRLKTCGDHCPNWSTCPLAQPDLEAVPLQKRPVCPYEQAQYNTALADALDLSCCVNKMNPFAIHIAHNVATLQVMLGRAAGEIRNSDIVSQANPQPDKQPATHEQLRPQINAISRIGAELRKYLFWLAKAAPNETSWDRFMQRCRWVRSADHGPEPEEYDYVPPDEKKIAREREQKNKTEAQKAITRAVLLAQDSKPDEARAEWEKAAQLQPELTQTWTNNLRKSVKAKQRAELRAISP